MNGVMHDLNTLVVSGTQRSLTDAVAINAAGQILANACSPRCEIYRLDPLTAAKSPAVEFHHATFDHYFLTSRRSRDRQAGRRRLGMAPHRRRVRRRLHGADVDQPGCRFFSASFAPKSSHFYTRGPGRMRSREGQCALAVRRRGVLRRAPGRIRCVPGRKAGGVQALQQRLERSAESSLHDESVRPRGDDGEGMGSRRPWPVGREHVRVIALRMQTNRTERPEFWSRGEWGQAWSEIVCDAGDD